MALGLRPASSRPRNSQTARCGLLGTLRTQARPRPPTREPLAALAENCYMLLASDPGLILQAKRLPLCSSLLHLDQNSNARICGSLAEWSRTLSASYVAIAMVRSAQPACIWFGSGCHRAGDAIHAQLKLAAFYRLAAYS